MQQVNRIELQRTSVLRYLLKFLFVMALLQQFGTASGVLNQMRLSGEPLPLQTLLNQLSGVWSLVHSFWTFFLGAWLTNTIFYIIGIGGVVVATFLWYIWTRPTIEESRVDPENLLGHRLLLIFSMLMLLTIILGMNTDTWVPYNQDPNFTINLKHKHQLSAGIYFNLYFQLWHRAKSPQFRLHLASKYLSQRPYLISYMFLVNMLDNLAAFDWFPFNLGFQDVYLDGPSIVSFDKVYHALGSSFFTILTIYLLTSVYRGTLFSIFGNVLWEIFEISIQPAEFGDSGLDLIFDVFATLVTALLISKSFGDKSNKENQIPISVVADVK